MNSLPNLKALAICALTAIFGTSASAATLSVSGGNALTYGSTTNYDASCGTDDSDGCFDPNGPGISLAADLLTSDGPNSAPLLSLVGTARIIVTFLGKEANAINTAFTSSGEQVVNTAAAGSMFSFLADSGVLDFGFKSDRDTGATNGQQPFGGAALAFSEVSSDGKSIFAFFDDSGLGFDRDFDDMVIRIDVSAVPLPAGMILLLTGLTSLIIFRKKVA